MALFHRHITAIIAAATIASEIGAQVSAPILRHPFDESTSGWMAIGQNARISVSTQTSFNGRGALRFDYEIAKGKFSALMLTTPMRILEPARSIRFWVSVDRPTSLALLLQEKGGARYMSPFSVTKGGWQAVYLTLSDFQIMEGSGGPTDANGRLDADQVVSLALLDFGQMMVSIRDTESAKAPAVAEGKRTLYLDDFTVLREQSASPTPSPGSALIDRFDRPQIGWIGIGGVSLSNTASKTPNEHGMQVDYNQRPGEIVGLLRPIRPGALAGMSRLSMIVGSTQAATLVIQVEEAGGGKFNTMETVRAGEVPREITVDFSTLNPAEDSPVKGRSLDPAKVTRLLILDAFGMLEMPQTQQNRLIIRNVRGVAKP